jgi:hypothetical protein
MLPHLVQKSSLFTDIFCRQGLSTTLMLSSVSQWTDKCIFHRLCDEQTCLLSKTTAGALGYVLDLLFGALASIFPAALRSQHTMHYLPCWDEGPYTDLICSHLLSSCTAPCLLLAFTDQPLKSSVSTKHPFMHHYIPYICNLSAIHILQWAMYTQLMSPCFMPTETSWLHRRHQETAFWDGWPFAADTLPATGNIYTSINSSVCMTFFKAHMTDVLSKKFQYQVLQTYPVIYKNTFM